MDLSELEMSAASSSPRRWSARQLEIFDQLQDLVLAKGFRDLTIADFVDWLHCSRRTLYGLAPSREELLLIVIDRLLDQMSADAEAAARRCDDPGEAVATYLTKGVTTLRGVTCVFMDDLESYGPTKQLYDRHVASALDTLGKLVEDGMSRGAFRQYHPPLVAEILDAAVDRIRRPDVLARAGVSLSQALLELSELMRCGLVAPSPTPRPAQPQKRRTPRSRR